MFLQRMQQNLGYKQVLLIQLPVFRHDLQHTGDVNYQEPTARTMP